MMRIFHTPFRWIAVFLLVLVAACAGPTPLPGSARIAMIGDSVLAWNGLSGRSVGHQLGQQLGEPVSNFSVVTARMSWPVKLGTPLAIPNQLGPGPFDVVVLNGGANDLYFECLCLECPRVIDSLIDEAGNGEIPDLMRKLRAETGAEIIYAGYHRSRGLGGPYERCGKPLNVVEDRIARFAATTAGLSYVDMKDVFPPASTAHYDFDRIHPSVLGSGLIAARLADRIRALSK